MQAKLLDPVSTLQRVQLTKISANVGRETLKMAERRWECAQRQALKCFLADCAILMQDIGTPATAKPKRKGWDVNFACGDRHLKEVHWNE